MWTTFILLHSILTFYLNRACHRNIWGHSDKMCQVYYIVNFALAIGIVKYRSLLFGAKVWSVLICESVPVVTNIHHFPVLSAGIVSHIAECVNIYPELRTFLIFYGTTPQISVLYLLSHIICVGNWFINKVRWLCDYVYCLSASSSIPRDLLLLWAVSIL